MPFILESKGGLAMNKTTVIFLSGFLGSGKTTLMLTAAKLLRAKGLTAACITNDQGDQLVDSKMVLKKELPMEQIQGGCFCCKFDDLVDSINEVVRKSHPQVIFAEAVGSCTDLMATVIKPLQQFHGNELSIYPLTVVVDPYRLHEFIMDQSTFTSEIVYIFRKQLEEAQVIVLNKMDLISISKINELEAELNHIYDAKVVKASAIHESGIDAWLQSILHFDSIPMPIKEIRILEIDYDIYAKGEAQLGWLNGMFSVTGQVRNVSQFCESLVIQLLDRFILDSAEVAHLKLWAEDNDQYIKISSVSNARGFETDVLSSTEWHCEQFLICLNVRVNLKDSKLKEIISSVTKLICNQYKVEISIDKMNCFAPSRPNPTHRIA